MAHLDRGDDWTNLLQKLLRALCPLNPALFWAERQLCLEREQACDDAVLDAAGNARAYATCLTKLAETRLVKRAALLAPGMWKRHSELAGRVENILHRRRGLDPCFRAGWSRLRCSLPSSARWCCNAAPASLPLPATTQSLPPAPATDRSTRQDIQSNIKPAIRKPSSIHDMSQPAERASVLPKPHVRTTVKTSRRLQFLQVTEDEDGGGITLILFTVEVPQSSRVSHGEPLPTLPTPDHWIAFQI